MWGTASARFWWPVRDSLCGLSYRVRISHLIVCGWLFVVPCTAQVAGTLFDAVGKVLLNDYCDVAFRRGQLPKLLADYRPKAQAAQTSMDERDVVRQLLAQVPASHLALYSKATAARLEAEIAGEPVNTLGCVLTQVGDRYFADSVYDGGPAALAGLRRGDEVIAIDGLVVKASPRFDWRSDDARSAGFSSHELLVQSGDRVSLRVNFDSGCRDVAVVAAPFSGFLSSKFGARSFAIGGQRALLLHLWFVYHGLSASLLSHCVAANPGCRSLLLDLRGRGGSALECAPLLATLKAMKNRGVSIVALIDHRTRSAKEIIAYELRRSGIATLVGECTAGAMLPATLVPVGADAVLMYPALRAGNYCKAIEGHGVLPQHEVADPFPGRPGFDPVLEKGIEVLQATRVAN